ncbi:MAG: hypothetical protein NTW78_09440 [Campylobacterales bacterium]|nr:hypothetical protein [Campylobacterales bacterium]
MKIIFTAVTIILISSSLGAYTKQIVFDSFKDRESANAAFEKLKSDEIYSKLELISKENDFDIHVTASGKKNLLVAEPIKNQYILEETLKLIMPKFLKATAINIEELSQNVAQTSSVYASLSSQYPKKVILKTYSKKEVALEELEMFQKKEVYEKLNTLATKNDFAIYVRPLGNYTVLIIEPIKNQEVYQEVMNLVQPKFKSAFSRKYDVINKTNQTKEEEQSLKVAAARMSAIIPTKKEADNKNISVTKTDANNMAIKVDTNITAPLVKEINMTNQAIKESSYSVAAETKVATKSVESAKKEETIVVKKIKEEAEDESSFAMFVWLIILGIAAGAIIYAYPKAKRVYNQY